MSTNEISLKNLKLRSATVRERALVIEAIYELTRERKTIQRIMDEYEVIISKTRVTTVYYCTPQMLQILEQIDNSGFQKLSLISVGKPLGIIRGHKFLVGIELLDLVSLSTKKGILLNKKGEQHFLYGNDINQDHITGYFGPTQISEKIIIFNTHKTPLGIGYIEYLTYDENNEIKSVDIKNLIDLGFYLRSED